MGHGWLARLRVGREDGHAQTVAHVAGDISLYAPFFLHKVGPDERDVATMGCLVEELLAEQCLGFRCLGHHQQTAGVLVDTMNQSHLGVVRVKGRHVAHVPCHGIDERAVEVASSRMHHHARRLVDDHQLVVLIHDVKRNVLRHDARVVLRLVEHQGNHVLGTYLVVALYRRAIDVDGSSVGGLLYAVAA